MLKQTDIQLEEILQDKTTQSLQINDKEGEKRNL